MNVSEKLAELGLALPEVAAPVAAYVPAIKVADTVRTSGQLPMKDGKLAWTGKCVNESDIVRAKEAAAQCALNALAAAAQAAGGLDKLKSVVKVTGFVCSDPQFFAQPKVIDAASEFFKELFGSLHIRSAVGVAALPLDATVELEVEFAL